MTGPSVMLPVEWLDSEMVEDLGSDAAMLLLTALAHSAQQTSDGVIARRALRKLWPVPDVEDAVARLVAAGEAEERGDQLFLVNWEMFILPRAEVDARRESNRVRAERSRRHQRGDHTLCRSSYCSKAGESRVTQPVTDGVSSALPIRPDPTRTDPQGGKGKGRAQGASAGAPAPRPPEGEGAPVFVVHATPPPLPRPHPAAS